MRQRQLLWVGLAFLVGVLVLVGFCAIGWQVRSTYANSNTPTASATRRLPPLRVIQSTLTPASPPQASAAGGAAAPAQLAAAVGAPEALNGVPVDELVLLPAGVVENIRAIYARGHARHRNTRAFSKIGDSNMEAPYFMAPFDDREYNLGPYTSLDETIQYFSGSFGRKSLAVHMGFHSWSVLDETLSDKSVCWPNETPLECELRVHNPSIALIRLGTNDAGHPERLRASLQTIVKTCAEQGVVPVLGTKADRAEGPDDVNNAIIREVAGENQVPVWDFDRLAATVPDKGLGQDHVHLTTFPSDYTLQGAFEHGHSLDNLGALMVLDRVWRVMSGT